MKRRNLVAIGLVIVACSVVMGTDANPKMTAPSSGGCYCITMDCVGCGYCIEMLPECFCWNASETRAQFCIPNDCGDPYSFVKLCDADERIEEAAAACYADAIQRCYP